MRADHRSRDCGARRIRIACDRVEINERAKKTLAANARTGVLCALLAGIGGRNRGRLQIKRVRYPRLRDRGPGFLPICVTSTTAAPSKRIRCSACRARPNSILNGAPPSRRLQARPRTRDDGAEAKIRWAFISFRPDNDWLFRVGRVRPPFGIHFQNAEVGVTYDQVRLPQEVYSFRPVYDFDGGAVTKTWSLGNSET